MANVKILQAGAAKPKGVWPYAICIVANPWIESPQDSGQIIADPIVGNEPMFDAQVRYIVDALTGRLAGQAEKMFAPLAADWRIVSIFDPGRSRKKKNALVAHDNTNIVVPVQPRFPPFLKEYKLPKMGKAEADVAFAVTASATHDRCSAWFTLDDDTVPGRPFTLDGKAMVHRPRNKLPGTAAIHVTAKSLVALHEFGHAASSWTNGMITDLYVDGGEGLNKRFGRPIPGRFCVYDNQSFLTAPNRGGILAYPAGWTSYHGELADPAFPAVMDDYWQAAGGRAEKCRHDKLTRQFLLDRVQTIMAR
ncbi:MAG: hypothetical protein QOG72_3299 [Sphingomonadales bacterium]|jgi:hypothetical protein|nr:hypothetical protein [Sphingomonadales bacterium]